MAAIRDISKSGVGSEVEFEREAPNLFKMIDSQRARKDLKKDKEEQQKQADLKTFNEFIEYDSPEFWQPFDNQVKSKYDDYQNFVAKARSEGKYTDPEVLAEINKRKADIDIFAKKTVGLKTEFKNNYTEWSEIPGIKKDELHDLMMKSTIRNEDGSVRSQEDIVDSFDNSILRNESLYDYNVIVKTFVDNIADKVTSELNQGGPLNETVRTTAKSYVKLNDEGKVVRDVNGEPILNISEELVSEAMSNTAMAARVDKLVEDKKKNGFPDFNRKNAVEQIVRLHSGTKENKTWARNHAYFEAKRNERNNSKNKDKDKEYAVGLLKPWATLMRGNGWDGYEFRDGKDYRVASVPLNTNQIGDNEYIGKLYRDEDGQMWYSTVDKSGEPLKDGKLLSFSKTGGLLSRMMNYSEGVNDEEKKVINSYIENNTDDFGNLRYEPLVKKETKVKDITSEEKFTGRIGQFFDEYDGFDFKKLEGKIGTTPKEVVNNLNKILNIRGDKVEVKTDSDYAFIGDKEIDLYVNGELVDNYENLDHNSESDMKRLFNYVNNLEKQQEKQEETKESTSELATDEDI